jgi:Heparan-alpha-glucosaminide N-acetyltransferase, catalytic
MNGSSGGAQPKKRSVRWIALDLLRFCAVFLMVQGHTFTTLLDPSVRAERWYRHHNFVHGYTAPMFLFASGLAFGFTTFKAWKANTSLVGSRAGLLKRFRRYAFLLALGYALHLPVSSIWALFSLNEAQLRQWTQVDVLQHIAVSLAFCQALAIALRTPQRFALAIAVIACVVVFSAPYVAAWNVAAYLPYPLAGFVNGSNHALFPMVPWAGFTYAGILFSYFARNADRPSQQRAWPFAIASALFLLVPIAVNRLGFQPYPPHDFWQSSPYFFFWRLGNVTAVLTLLCFVERAIERAGWLAHPERAPGRALVWIRAVGQESLAVYVSHLLVLHGWVMGRGAHHYFGESLSLIAATAFALWLFVAMVVLARVWNRIKTSRRRAR